MIDAVFENPTDLEVNFKLLEEQTQVGDLRGAAATLDRILLLDPDSKLARVSLAECEQRLQAICNPDAINAMAFRDQQKRIEDFGEVEACLSAPAFNATPTPI